MNINKINNNEVAIIGRIESSNASDFEKKLMGDLENSDGTVTLDCEKLEYISSAGLRVLLKLKKEKKCEVILKNTNPVVYEILETTGFSVMLTVKKALRTISIDGCELIGRGGNGHVYRLDEDTIVKLYRSDYNEDSLEKIRKTAREAFVKGINSAIPFDVVRCGDSLGIVYEMIKAEPLTQIYNRNPHQIEEISHKYADFVRSCHEIEFPSGTFPKLKDYLLGFLQYTEKYVSKEFLSDTENFINAIPDKNTFLHGDFHCDNIMVSGDDMYIIDTDTVMQGHIIGDLLSVRTMFDREKLMSGYVHVKINPDIVDDAWDYFLRGYFNCEDPNRIKEIKQEIDLYVGLRTVLMVAYSPSIPDEVKQVAYDTKIVPPLAQALKYYAGKLSF